MLFSELAKLYLEDKESGRKKVRLNTLEGYKSAMNSHVLPKWGQREVASISYEDVQEWVDSFPEGIAAERSYKVLRQCLRWGIAKRVIAIADPTVGIDVPEPQKRGSDRVLKPGELNQLLYKCVGQVWEAMVWVQATTGLRRCEAAALTWGDIDLRAGVVHVTKGRHVVNGETYVWGTKTESSTRDVPIPHFAVLHLRNLKKKLKASADDLLCDLRPDAISRRFRAWCKSHGFDGATLMRLRHTWATLAVQAGVPIEVVARQLGHAGLELAYSTYVTRSLDILRAGQKRFAELILKAAPKGRLEAMFA